MSLIRPKTILRNIKAIFWDITYNEPTPHKEGTMFWDKICHTLGLQTDIPDLTLQVGQEMHVRVKNNTALKILKPQVIRIDGSDSGIPTANLAQSNTFNNSLSIAVANQDIEIGEIGLVTSNGIIKNLDTSLFTEGDALYLSGTIPGLITKNEPVNPNLSIILGYCLISHATEGKILVDIKSPKTSTYEKSYVFTSRGVGAGVFYLSGYYFAPSADSNLTQAGPTQSLGSINNTYAAHAFAVVSGVGTSNKTTGAVRLRVSGTSIDDLGVRTALDEEVIIADIEDGAVITDAYFESSKKWIGAITYTLENDGTGDATTFSLDFNYGFAKYEDFGNRNFNVTELEVVGLCASTDTDFNIELIKHSSQGWTYASSGFIPGGSSILDFSAINAPEDVVTNTEPFAFKRTNLSESIDGSAQEGIILKITTGQNNTVQILNAHLRVDIV